MTFRVLFVCTGNLCRSPMGAVIMRERSRRLGVRIDSAGTHARPGLPVDATAALALHELGHPLDDHRTTRLTGALVEQTDLVLTATVEHRRHVLSETPSAIRRAFTLLEFARLSAGVGTFTGELDQRIAEIAAQRGVSQPGQDDIADPFRQPLAVMRECAQTIDTAIAQVVHALGLAPRPGRHRRADTDEVGIAQFM